MQLIIGSAILLGALSVNLQDPPPHVSPSTNDKAPVTAGQRRARIELNEAVQSYHEGNLSEARRHAETAREYDPLNQIAPLFLARIIHRQYKPGDQSLENVLRAREAIEAYQRILLNEKQNDEAYKAIASLYGAIKEDESQRQWIRQRAVDTTFSSEQRAEAYVVLGSKDWDCANRITDQPANRIEHLATNSVSYKKPKAEAEFQEASRCVSRGLEEIESAIGLAPNSEAAWSYKMNLLLELSKMAEMESRLDRKTSFERQAHEAQRRVEELNRVKKQQTP